MYYVSRPEKSWELKGVIMDFPLTEEIYDTFDTLLPTEIEVMDETFTQDPESGVIGVYFNEDDIAVGAIVMDYDLANFMGAAMTRIPSFTAEENAEEMELPEMVFENIEEIYNVASKHFKRPSDDRINFDEIVAKPSWQRYPSGFVEVVDRPRRDRRIEFDVKGYGSGFLDIYKN